MPLSFCLCLYLDISVSSSVCLSVCLSDCLSSVSRLSVCLSVCSVCLPLLSVCLSMFVCLSVYLSVCLVCLSDCLCLSLACLCLLSLCLCIFVSLSVSVCLSSLFVSSLSLFVGPYGRLSACLFVGLPRHSTPQKCSAPQYVDHVMTWVEDQINKEDIFPTTPGEKTNRK